MLKLFRSHRAEPDPFAGPRGSRAYAIGDVHGRLDLMLELLDRIEADNRARGPARTYVIFLGDLVDRGPDSKGVIDHLLTRPPSFARTVFLAGNHEEAFTRVLDGETAVVPGWLTYGGRECAQSYGINSAWLLAAPPDAIISEVRRAVPKSHVDFLRGLHDTFKFGDYLFVHAGIRPGVPVEDQLPGDLRWIREGFLDDETDHGVMVVHGHTIVEEVEERPNRIGIDTGAYRSGVLTALAVEGRERRLIQASLD
ncbi:MAG TPA: metallophosphoesterase family protein [Allosphingosinicella sp.]|nr:metallophosphoesterase family protein [Allosphingosinicella sp.]